MTAPSVAYDLTRLFIGPVQATPRGIDRVELGFATHFLRDWPGTCVATLPTPFGVRTVKRQDALHFIDCVENHWGERCDPDRDRLMDWLADRLAGRTSAGRPLTVGNPLRRLATMIGHTVRHARCTWGPLATQALPADTLYLNTGQVGIAIPWFLSWLTERPDVKPVFMLHDLIPIEHQQFVPASSTYFHRQMVANVASRASGLITTTKFTSSAIRRELDRLGRCDIPVIAEPLPVAPAFLSGAQPDQRLGATPYFVIVGSIEPRKNHALLLNVWQSLAQSLGSQAPKLVIVGSRWTGHEPVTRRLDRSAVLRDLVIEVGGLTTPSMQRLISNARGLLMPSFAEGFGLPIVEGQALGVPVIASDIDAHREAGKFDER